MSDEQTQAPSRRRRQQARDEGLVAWSPELMLGLGLLVLAIGLRVFGRSIVESLVDAMRSPWVEPFPTAIDADYAIGLVRSLIVRVGLPVGALLAAWWVALVLVQQLQTGGMWAPLPLRPDPTRLIGGLGGYSGRLGWACWGLAKAAATLLGGVWALWSSRGALETMGAMTADAIGNGAVEVVARLAMILGLISVAAGVAEYGLRWRSVEARLRTTPDQAREEQRSLEGDPSARGRRIRAARARRADVAGVGMATEASAVIG